MACGRGGCPGSGCLMDKTGPESPTQITRPSTGQVGSIVRLESVRLNLFQTTFVGAAWEVWGGFRFDIPRLIGSSIRRLWLPPPMLACSPKIPVLMSEPKLREGCWECFQGIIECKWRETWLAIGLISAGGPKVKRRLLPKVPDLIYWRIPQPGPVEGETKRNGSEELKKYLNLYRDPHKGCLSCISNGDGCTYIYIRWPTRPHKCL